MLNQATIESNKTSLDSQDNCQIITIDPLLARVVNNSDSQYGINNITIESDITKHSVPFERNGVQVDSFDGSPVTDYYKH